MVVGARFSGIGAVNMAWDLNARELAWNNQVSDVFNTDTEIAPDMDFVQLSRDITSAHKRVIKLWWNIKSLEQYVKTSIVPRGLRVQIFPAWEVTGDFKQSWEKALLQCSRILLNLLIEHDQQLLIDTKKQILTLEADLIKFDPTTLVNPFQKKLKETLEVHEKEVMAGKKKKFSRDKTDFEKQNAFRWQHQGNRRNQWGPSKPKGQMGAQRTNPAASTSSDFLSSMSEGESEPEGANENPNGRTRSAKSKGPPQVPNLKKKYT